MKRFINRDKLKEMVNSTSPVVIVEALPKKYYDEGHIPGAINIPHDEVNAKATRLIPDKETTIVVYCSSIDCKNSSIAGESFRKLGYSNVLEYSHGKKDWTDGGHELEKIHCSSECA